MDYEKNSSEQQPPKQRRKPPTRNSNAAQVAQRRREEREERAHLENLRQKQTRKAKKRNKTKKRISRVAVKRILIMLGILLALILSMIIFFRVRNIEVQTVRKDTDPAYNVENINVNGNGYYTANQIIAASGLEEGDNLLLISRADIAGNIMAKCPYVSTVRVVRQLPSTVQIFVEEYAATYAVRDSKGDYYLITAGGKVTDKVDEIRAVEHIRIRDLTIQTPTIGEMATVMAPSGQEVAAQGQMDALKLLLQQIEEQDLFSEITSVSVPNSFDLSMEYSDRFTVKIGDTSELKYKINYLKSVIKEQKPYATGTIDLTQAAEGKVSVMLDQE